MTEQLFNSILLLEDDPSHALIVKRVLTKICSELKHASTLKDTQTYLETFTPELIISDLHLPDVSGIDGIKALLQHNIPLVVLTSSTSWSDAVTALKLGAKDFIVKDFSNNFSEAILLALTRLHDAIELTKERRKLISEMELLKNTIENSNDALAIIEKTGDIKYQNSAFKCFSVKCGLINNNITQIFSEHISKLPELINNIQLYLDTLSAGAVWHTEITFTNDNSAYDLSLSAATDHTTKDYVIWIKDITDIKQREKFQREMLSTTTHDLKGPLGAISLSAELIESLTNKGDKVNDIALRIASSAQGSLNLIEEFLSTRRLQEGNFILKPCQFYLHEALSEIYSNYQTIASAKGIDFQVLDCQPTIANIDKIGFERIISNILNNAFKFTPRNGSVTVSYGKNTDNSIWILVNDTGTGMEPAEVSHIFQRYTCLERHNSISGSGLGLAVVKNIVTAHAGTIEVTSQLNHGTSFKITFPETPPINKHGELISLDFI